MICVLEARPRRCPTLSNPVPWQNWMVVYLGYTLQMKTLFRGWPVMVHDTHTSRRLRGWHHWFCCRIQIFPRMPVFGVDKWVSKSKYVEIVTRSPVWLWRQTTFVVNHQLIAGVSCGVWRLEPLVHNRCRFYSAIFLFNVEEILSVGTINNVETSYFTQLKCVT